MYGTIDIGDLYLFPNILFSAMFEPFMYEKCDGKISPILYLTMYTCNMIAHINNEKLLMPCF